MTEKPQIEVTQEQIQEAVEIVWIMSAKFGHEIRTDTELTARIMKWGKEIRESNGLKQDYD